MHVSRIKAQSSVNLIKNKTEIILNCACIYADASVDYLRRHLSCVKILKLCLDGRKIEA